MSDDEAAKRAPQRVIQWATGTVGRAALRAILLDPALGLRSSVELGLVRTGIGFRDANG